MKSLIVLSLLFIFLGINIAKSQITAGEIPIDMTTSNPNLLISVNVTGQSMTKSFDIDCDSINDMSVILYKGYTAIDGSSYTNLIVTNPVYEVCATLAGGGYYESVNFYNYGDSLTCSGTYQWSNDATYYMGNYGCMDCPGPYTITDNYIAFRKIDTLGIPQIGWFKISFDLNDAGSASAPITLTINEVLNLCNTTYILEIEKESVTINPNPTKNGIVHVNNADKIYKMELLSMTGQLIKTFHGIQNEIYLPEIKGIYIMKIWDSKENYKIEKVIYN